MIFGTMIRATLRPQDLIPAFVRAFLRMRYTGFDCRTELSRMVDDTPIAYNPESNTIRYPGDDHEWWESEDAALLVNEDLIDALNDFAPPGDYFGAHPGDGSDFGYWENEYEYWKTEEETA